MIRRHAFFQKRRSLVVAPAEAVAALLSFAEAVLNRRRLGRELAIAAVLGYCASEDGLVARRLERKAATNFEQRACNGRNTTSDIWSSGMLGDYAVRMMCKAR
jgi:hypothetical protein